MTQANITTTYKLNASVKLTLNSFSPFLTKTNKSYYQHQVLTLMLA